MKGSFSGLGGGDGHLILSWGDWQWFTPVPDWPFAIAMRWWPLMLSAVLILLVDLACLCLRPARPR